MKSSSKKILRKSDFPCFNSFPSAMSHFRKSTKMWFPTHQPKKPQLHNYRKSSIMVIRGWYLTHFDSRDLLKSKKNWFGWIPQLIRSPRADLRNFPIFPEFSQISTGSKKPIFLTFESEIFFKNDFYMIHFFLWNYDTLAPFLCIYIGLTPSSSRSRVFWNLVVRFFPTNVNIPILKTSLLLDHWRL